MLKPIAALQNHGQAMNWSDDDLRRKQEKLLGILLRPSADDRGATSAIFAHGAEVVRLAALTDVTDPSHPHWAVQTWNVTQEDWVTQKAYPMKAQLRLVALEDAKTWYPPPIETEALARWGGILSSEEDTLERLFDRREKFAEFWYETKAIDWSGRYKGDPWPFFSDVAAATFDRGTSPNPMNGEKYEERVAVQVANFAADWGELPKPVLSGWLRHKDTNEPLAIVQYSSSKEAIDDILRSGHDAWLRATPLGERSLATKPFTYRSNRDSAHSQEQLIEALDSYVSKQGMHSVSVNKIATITEDSFLISIHSESWTDDDKEAGEPGERLIVIEREAVDADELKRYGRKYGLSEPSVRDPAATPHVWFNSVTPDENRDHFERGIDTFYRLDLHAVNDREPGADDYRRVADLIGAKFDEPLLNQSSLQP